MKRGKIQINVLKRKFQVVKKSNMTFASRKIYIYNYPFKIYFKITHTEFQFLTVKKTHQF